MFVKNYYSLLNERLGGGYSYENLPLMVYGGFNAPSLSSYSNFAIKTCLTSHINGSVLNNTSNSAPTPGVVFANGNVPVSIEDYKQSGDALSNITVSCSVEVVSDAKGQTITGNYTITNNATEPQTIGEVCIFSGILYRVGSYNQGKYVMIERTVLDSPVTIPAGGTGQVTYTIRLDYPTA